MTLSTETSLARDQKGRVIRGVGIMTIQTGSVRCWRMHSSSRSLSGQLVTVQTDSLAVCDGQAGISMATVTGELWMNRGLQLRFVGAGVGRMARSTTDLLNWQASMGCSRAGVELMAVAAEIDFGLAEQMHLRRAVGSMAD